MSSPIPADYTLSILPPTNICRDCPGKANCVIAATTQYAANSVRFVVVVNMKSLVAYLSTHVAATHRTTTTLQLN